MNTLSEYQLLRNSNISKLTECYQFIISQYGLTPDELKSRRQDVIIVTHAAWCALRDYGSFPQIGKAVDRNHASVINAVKNHEGRLRFDRDYRRVFEKIKPAVDAFFNEESSEKSASDFTNNMEQLREITRLKKELSAITAANNYLSKSLKALEEENDKITTKHRDLKERYQKLKMSVFG